MAPKAKIKADGMWFVHWSCTH